MKHYAHIDMTTRTMILPAGTINKNYKGVDLSFDVPHIIKPDILRFVEITNTYISLVLRLKARLF